MYEGILKLIPPEFFTSIGWAIVPVVTLVLVGAFGYFSKRVPSLLCGLFTVGCWFLVLAKQSVEVQSRTDIRPMVLGMVEVVPLVFLASGLMAVVAIYDGRKNRKIRTDVIEQDKQE